MLAYDSVCVCCGAGGLDGLVSGIAPHEMGSGRVVAGAWRRTIEQDGQLFVLPVILGMSIGYAGGGIGYG